MTALDDLLMKKYRDSIAGLTSNTSSNAPEIPSDTESEPEVQPYETLVTEIVAATQVVVPASAAPELALATPIQQETIQTEYANEETVPLESVQNEEENY